MPVSTLITTRSVTITTFITEAWSTVSEEVTPSPTTETEGVDYPFPTWTGCPDVNNAFKCAGDDNDEDDDDQRHVIAVKARAGTGEGDEAESSVTDDTEPQESVAMFSSARGTRDAVCGLLWLVMGVMMVML